jgi:hypothetical protein
MKGAVMPIEALAAIFAAAVLIAVFSLLLWGIARGSRRLLGTDAAATEAIARCVSCAQKPVCETGALAGWLHSRPPRCPSLDLLQRSKPLQW